MNRKLASFLVLIIATILSLPSYAQVEPPKDAEIHEWYGSGTYVSPFGSLDSYQWNPEVAIVGNEVYIRGMFDFFYEWIKGTINGTTVTFECPQYLGDDQNNSYYAFGSDGYTADSHLQDFQMTYDAEAQTLTSVNNLLANIGTDGISFIESYTEFTLSKNAPTVEEPTASTGANIDVLPYSNALTTANDFSVFGVLDTNEDDITWVYNNNYGTNYANARYIAGDDWLVSPAVKLEAGKHYHFSIDARHYYSAGGRFEVKIANGEAKASVLTAGTTLIASTDVTSTFTTYENNDFTVSETGYYYFGIHAISDAGYDFLTVAKFFVEEGSEASAPAAVENLSITPLDGKLGAIIAFTAPKKTIGGDMLTADGITKIEVLRDDMVITTIETPAPGAELSYVDEANDLTIGDHKYQVVSYGTAGVGGKSEVVSVSLSGILTVPTSFDLTKQDVYNTFQTIDANHDIYGAWEWDPSTGTRYYGSEQAADDYLVSSGVQLEAGENYKVTVTARCHIQGVAERFEVKVGKEATVAGLNLTAMNPTKAANAEFEDYESEFTVPESGIYHIAIHAISDADMWRLYVSRLAIDGGSSSNAPAAPTLTVKADAQGAEKATITVTAPTKSADGADLSANLMKIEVQRDGEVVKTFENVAPGATESFTDENVTAGKHVYQAIPYNANGAGQKSEKVTVYVGEEYEPANVKNVHVSAETATTLTFTWDKAEGKNGGYVNAANVQYDLVALVTGENADGNIYMYEGKILGTVTGKTTVTINYPVDEGIQDYKYFGVKATIGENESDARANSITVIIGAPYDLPMEETYNGAYSWFGNDNAAIGISEEGHGDNTALELSARKEAGLVSLETGKLHMQPAANATLLFDARKGSSMVEKMTIYGITPDGTTTDLETVTLTNAYQTYKVLIPANVKNGRWSRLGFKADFETTEKTILLDNIKVLDFYQYDLSVTVAAPAFAQTGSKTTIAAVVKNEGENAVSGYTVIVKADGKELLSTVVNEELQPFATKVFSADFTTSVFDKPADIVATATAELANDQRPANNTAETTISMRESTAPGVTDVNMEETAGGVVVSWKAPDTDVALAGKVTEDFETGEAGWTFVDADADGFNWEYLYDKAIEGSLAHSGSGIMYSESFTAVSETTAFPLTPDNWLISPQAVLDGTFKFWAIGQDPNDCAEHFQVYVSTTSATDVSTFKPVGEEFVATNTYTEYAVDLGEYAGKAGWIAIRHFNVTDMFRLIIDDITYHIGIEKYNIYVDSQLAASVDADKSTATVEGIEPGDHKIAVSVVYANGRESKPMEGGLASGLSQITVIAKPIDVYSLDGRLVRQQTTTFDGLKGVYVVEGKKVVLK